MVNSIPSWQVWAEINSMMHVVLPISAINQFKPVHQSRLTILIYIYTVKKSRRKRDLKIVSSAKTEAEAVTLH